jgi:tetratricopeptide (TPR) repeat protein
MPLFWSNLALMRLTLQDLDGTNLALKNAIRADPFDAQSRALSARVALALNDLERASREGHFAVELEPLDPTLYDVPTEADLQLGRIADAERMLRAGLERIRPPDSLELHLLLAQVLHAEGKNADALAELVAVLTIDPKNEAALKLLPTYR